MLKTPDQHAEALGTDPHILAGAKVHHDWIAGHMLDEASYQKAIGEFANLPINVGSPQLLEETAKRVLAQHKKNLAEQAAFNAKHARTIKASAKLSPEAQTAALAPIRRAAAALHAQHQAAIKSVVRGSK